MKTLKLKRHETFTIREGWLEKAINQIAANPTTFGKDCGAKELGIGSNMVKSLRYWVQATNLISFNNKGAALTKLGEIIFKNDKYFEDDFTWWLIHLQLVTNFADAPVINTIYNLPFSSFDKEFLMRNLKEYYDNNNYEYGADSSLDSDISVFFKMYFSDEVTNPEENYGCPLSRLELLTSLDKKTFKKLSPSYESLNYRIVYLSIVKCFETANEDISKGISFNIEDLCTMKNNPLAIFNLSRSMLFLYLEDMRKAGLINLIKTAGLNTVYINYIKSEEEIINEYYK